MNCGTPYFLYPFYVDIYYPIITQNEYNQAQKNWVFDRTELCNAAGAGGASGRKDEIQPAVFLKNEGRLIARMKSDPRISSKNENNAITNILITNIRYANNELVYKETAGPRNNKGTIYEISALEPFVNPFGQQEYFKMVWRRTENQSVGD